MIMTWAIIIINNNNNNNKSSQSIYAHPYLKVQATMDKLAWADSFFKKENPTKPKNMWRVPDLDYLHADFFVPYMILEGIHNPHASA